MVVEGFMKTRLGAGLVIAALAIVSRTPRAATPQGQAESATVAGATAYRATLQQYCFSCHSNQLKAGGLALDGLDVSDVSQQREVWEKVAHKLRTGTMPPAGARRPDQDTYDRF